MTEIGIHFGEAEAAANAMLKLRRDYSTAIETMSQSTDSLRSTWDGETSAAWSGKLTKMRAEIEQLAQAVGDCGTALDAYRQKAIAMERKHSDNFNSIR